MYYLAMMSWWHHNNCRPLSGKRKQPSFLLIGHKPSHNADSFIEYYSYMLLYASSFNAPSTSLWKNAASISERWTLLNTNRESSCCGGVPIGAASCAACQLVPLVPLVLQLSGRVSLALPVQPTPSLLRPEPAQCRPSDFWFVWHCSILRFQLCFIIC
jgi:hypothetical protein